MKRRRLVLATVVAFGLVSARDAVGDDTEAVPMPEAPAEPTVIGGAGYLHLLSAAVVITDGGSELRLPPGYYLDEPNWQKLDLEVRRLQDQETRLTAENDFLRGSLSGWQPGWRTLAVTLAVGLVTGAYLHSKF